MSPYAVVAHCMGLFLLRGRIFNSSTSRRGLEDLVNQTFGPAGPWTLRVGEHMCQEGFFVWFLGVGGRVVPVVVEQAAILSNRCFFFYFLKIIKARFVPLGQFIGRKQLLIRVVYSTFLVFDLDSHLVRWFLADSARAGDGGRSRLFFLIDTITSIDIGILHRPLEGIGSSYTRTTLSLDTIFFVGKFAVVVPIDQGFAEPRSS